MSAIESVKSSGDSLLQPTRIPRAPRNMGQILRWLLLFFGGIVMIMPIVYMISTSLKWPHEVYNRV